MVKEKALIFRIEIRVNAGLANAADERFAEAATVIHRELLPDMLVRENWLLEDVDEEEEVIN